MLLQGSNVEKKGKLSKNEKEEKTALMMKCWMLDQFTPEN
jgi:hypothetical protein